MVNKEGCWKTEKGELHFNFISNIWTFSGSRYSGPLWISIISSPDTKKGPITEIVLENERKQVIIEILEKKFNKELYLSKQLDKTMKKVMEICRIVSNIETELTDYGMISSLNSCVQELMQWYSDGIKEVHTYYGNGLFFGMRKNIFGKTKMLNSIPSRCMQFPGSRIDSW